MSRKPPAWFWLLLRIWRPVRPFLVGIAEEYRRELFGAIGAIAYTSLRATGVQVDTGTTAVRFTCGIAGQPLDPGFHFLIPFLQRAPKVLTRARTLDLPAQRVATAEGLVYLVDTAIQFRVVDPRRALVQVVHLDRGLLTMVAMAVQAVIFEAGRQVLSDRAAIEERLTARLDEWTDAWGVTIEHAGFTSLTPSPRTLRVTQLSQAVLERDRMRARLEQAVAGDPCSALALLGPRGLPIRRARSLRAPTAASASARRVEKRLAFEGYRRDELARARRRTARLLGRDSESTNELRSDADRRSMRERLLAESDAAGRRALRKLEEA